MRKNFVYLFLFSAFIFNIKANAQNSYDSMLKSMQIEDIAYISISDNSLTVTFKEFAEKYADVVTDPNASPDQLEALGNLIQMWMNTLSQNFTPDQLMNECAKITSTLSCMSMLLILRVAIKDKNIPTEASQNSIYESIYNKFIPSFAQFKNDKWKTEFNFYVINTSEAVCKWYEDKSKKLDYPNFKVWKDGNF